MAFYGGCFNFSRIKICNNLRFNLIFFAIAPLFILRNFFLKKYESIRILVDSDRQSKDELNFYLLS